MHIVISQKGSKWTQKSRFLYLQQTCQHEIHYTFGRQCPYKNVCVLTAMRNGYLSTFLTVECQRLFRCIILPLTNNCPIIYLTGSILYQGLNGGRELFELW